MTDTRTDEEKRKGKIGLWITIALIAGASIGALFYVDWLLRACGGIEGC